MDQVVKILGVTVRATKTGKQVFDVQCSDGIERQCWDAGLAQKINSFANPTGVGADVTLRYDVKQNGQYTNYSIKAAFGPGEPVVPEPGAAMPLVMPAGVTSVPGTSLIQPSAPRGGQYPPEVTTRITKLASYEYATQLVGALFTGAGPEAFEQAMELTDEAAKRIYKSARSHESGGVTTTGSTAPITPVATTPEGVAEFANAAAPGAVQVGALVAVVQDAAAEAPDTIQWD